MVAAPASLVRVPRICRHNRFVAECPICSRGTVLDPDRPERRPRPAERGARRGGALDRRGDRRTAPAPADGPYAATGPYDGSEVRLERVPGGLRLAAWSGGSIERRAPVVEAVDLPGLVEGAVERELFAEAEAARLREALAPEARGAEGDDGEGEFGASPGRAGELHDELRVERLGGGRLRIGRWVLRPNAGWQLQEAPVMLPPARFAEAVDRAARRGLLAPERPAG